MSPRIIMKKKRKRRRQWVNRKMMGIGRENLGKEWKKLIRANVLQCRLRWGWVMPRCVDLEKSWMVCCLCRIWLIWQLLLAHDHIKLPQIQFHNNDSWKIKLYFIITKIFLTYVSLTKPHITTIVVRPTA